MFLKLGGRKFGTGGETPTQKEKQKEKKEKKTKHQHNNSSNIDSETPPSRLLDETSPTLQRPPSFILPKQSSAGLSSAERNLCDWSEYVCGKKNSCNLSYISLKSNTPPSTPPSSPPFSFLNSPTMGCLSVTLNIFFFVFGGGFIILLVYLLFAFFLAITVVGFKKAGQLFHVGLAAAFPYGQKVEPERSFTCKSDALWLPLGGLLYCFHTTLCLVNVITIIFIPFGLQHFQLANVALWPFGADIQDREVSGKNLCSPSYYSPDKGGENMSNGVV